MVNWRWDWSISPLLFTWVPPNVDRPATWKYNSTAWQITTGFFQQLRWQRDPGVDVSSYELAFVFFFKCRWQPPLIHEKEAGSLLAVLSWIRWYMREQRKWAQQILPPESRYEVQKTRNCSGKFPCGTVTGARPCFSPSELSALAELK